MVRVSGARTLGILDRLFPGSPPSHQRSHTLRLRWLVKPGSEDSRRCAPINAEGHRSSLPASICGSMPEATSEPLDQVMLAVFRAPRSYTGEDMAELSCHGGMVAADQVLRLLTGLGCRLAGPGEFTRRAVLAGKLTLTQAEAVADMVEAATEPAYRCALAQYRGELSHLVAGIGHDLEELLAGLEYLLGFDEPDSASSAVPTKRMAEITAGLDRAIAAAHNARFLVQGANVAIIGRPNAGKSSLFNRLLEQERAITSATPGTTRDRIEASIILGRVPVRLVDTAGFSPRAPGRLDRLALAQTREAVKQADLIIAVFDASRPYGRADREVVDSIRARPAVWVLNKTDLAIRFDERAVAGPAKWVPVSCRRGSGLPRLRSCLARMLSPGLPRLALNPRHLQALEACREALVRGRAAPNLETAALEVTAAIDMLNQIDAPAAPPEILDRVFARFCVGK